MIIEARIDGELAIIWCPDCREVHEHEWPWEGPILPKCPPGTGLWLKGYVWIEAREEDDRQGSLFW